MSEGRARVALATGSGGGSAVGLRLGRDVGPGPAAILNDMGMEDAAQTLASGAVETFATLVNKKVLLPSQRTSYIAVDMHFLVQRMRPLVSLIHVDEDWYATRYPDIVEARSSGRITSSKEHYVLFGYYEHRMPYRIDVQEEWYVAQYADVREAVAAGSFASGQAHFQDVGYGEGRLPFPHFRLRLAGAPS